MKKETEDCLVIIDVQQGFMANDATRALPERIARMVKTRQFKHIVGTCFVNDGGSPFVTEMGWHGCMSEEERKVMPQVAGLCEQVFCKPAYTCFTQTFEGWLASRDIGRLYFCGIDTDCCVLKSAADAFERGFKTDVLKDYCASSGGDMSHMAGLYVLKRLIGKDHIL